MILLYNITVDDSVSFFIFLYCEHYDVVLYYCYYIIIMGK